MRKSWKNEMPNVLCIYNYTVFYKMPRLIMVGVFVILQLVITTDKIDECIERQCYLRSRHLLFGKPQLT